MIIQYMILARNDVKVFSNTVLQIMEIKYLHYKEVCGLCKLYFYNTL